MASGAGGRGFTRSPGTKAFRAISVLIPDLQERTWNRNWRPFFDALVAKLEQEESHADQTFQKITGHDRFPSFK
ncbi:antitermination protein [Pantoea agglomerans]|nr:antitermination protein [Pantoea agglomerans]